MTRISDPRPPDGGRHPGVVALLAAAPGLSPEDAIRARVRALVDEVLGTLGWEGPPFDVAALASYCGYEVRYADGFSRTQDACITPRRITLNRAKPRRRQRYSISHEVVHTLVPGYQEELNRTSMLWRDEAQTGVGDLAEEELEHLCQVGAAEILLPHFAFAPRLAERGLSLETVIALSDLFDASTEATARRALELSSQPAALVFLASHDAAGHVLAPDDYTPYADLRVVRSYANAASVGATPALGMQPPNSSVAWKAWKRAPYRGLAHDVYVADELWNGTNPESPSRAWHVESMVLPRRATTPAEVLLLIRSP